MEAILFIALVVIGGYLAISTFGDEVARKEHK